ncbi:MAG TPA: 2-C-methyl-D-erythritol 4-phosphate cytidylyltransferase [Mariprofundaceae bacterium]|nr:2-C-methyl-D-erythritol 4-phosphate cytidylyltransferase [Mariprofundaceae bacterium]
MNLGVLLLAAGNGSRFGGSTPKQYVRVAGKALLVHTLHALAKEPRIQVVQPVLADGDDLFADAIAGEVFPFRLLPPVSGGPARSISMQRGLAALPDSIDLVAVHDAARPLPSPQLLADVVDMADRYGAAVPGIEVADTIKRMDESGRVLDTPDRRNLRAVQTPQVARRAWFEEALQLESEHLAQHTDDASLLEAAGFPVYISDGNVMNRKVTRTDDLEWLRLQLENNTGDA